MELKELPGELAYFVQQALASSTYQSADELVAEAVRLLKDREAERKARLHTPAPQHTRTSRPARQTTWCTRFDRPGSGRGGACPRAGIGGAQRYPAHAELHTYARLLAPYDPGSAASPAARASVKANGVWLKAHRTAYHGRWIALRDGALVRVADSFEALVADLGDTTGLLLTKVV